MPLMAKEFRATVPVFIETEHYSPSSRDRGAQRHLPAPTHLPRRNVFLRRRLARLRRPQCQAPAPALGVRAGLQNPGTHSLEGSPLAQAQKHADSQLMDFTHTLPLSESLLSSATAIAARRQAQSQIIEQHSAASACRARARARRGLPLE